jgi:DNA (cytosine-5)-methyltransferase 1
VVSCAEVHRPAILVVENVVEFRAWALFGPWCAALNTLGYALTPTEIDAADLGIPQHRKRLFIVGTRTKSPIPLRLPRRPHSSARSVIRWDGANWSQVDAKCQRTRARVAAGRAQHGRRFLIAYYGSARGGRSLDRPLGTITTLDRYGLVDGDRMRMLTVEEYRQAMAFPASYELPANRRTAIHLLGNAVCPPVSEALIRAVLSA